METEGANLANIYDYEDMTAPWNEKMYDKVLVRCAAALTGTHSKLTRDRIERACIYMKDKPTHRTQPHPWFFMVCPIVAGYKHSAISDVVFRHKEAEYSKYSRQFLYDLVAGFED